MSLTELGKAIRKERVDLGMNMADMAKAIKMPLTTLSAIETGARKPGLDFIERLIEEFPSISAKRELFFSLAARLRDEVKVKPDNDKAMDLAIAFARRVNSLDETQISKIKAVLYKDKN